MNKKTLFSLLLVAIAVYFLCTEFPNNKKPKYQHNDGFVFGTVYSVTYSNPDDKDLSVQIKNALNTVNNSLSMFNTESTISKINNNQPVELDPLFLTVWEKGQYISSCTKGAFDMTVAPLVDLWGFGLKNREQVTDLEVDSIRQYVGYELAVLEGGIIHKAYPEMRIDAGAIAKGYACDIVADTLEAYGCTDFCVEIGGEIVVKGINKKGVNWHIAINKPVEDSLCVNREIQEVIELTDCGMATSGNYRNYYVTEQGVKVAHTIDPRSATPVSHSLLSATVIAPTCAVADAYATAFMVMGIDSSKTLLQAHPELSVYFIYDDNGTLSTYSTIK